MPANLSDEDIGLIEKALSSASEVAIEMISQDQLKHYASGRDFHIKPDAVEGSLFCAPVAPLDSQGILSQE